MIQPEHDRDQPDPDEITILSDADGDLQAQGAALPCPHLRLYQHLLNQIQVLNDKVDRLLQRIPIDVDANAGPHRRSSKRPSISCDTDRDMDMDIDRPSKRPHTAHVSTAIVEAIVEADDEQDTLVEGPIADTHLPAPASGLPSEPPASSRFSSSAAPQNASNEDDRSARPAARHPIASRQRSCFSLTPEQIEERHNAMAIPHGALAMILGNIPSLVDQLRFARATYFPEARISQIQDRINTALSSADQKGAVPVDDFAQLVEHGTLSELQIPKTLAGFVWPDHAIDSFCQAVRANRCIQAVTIGSIDMTSDQSRYVARMLRSNLGLRKLALPFNKLGDKGAKYIAQALAHRPPRHAASASLPGTPAVLEASPAICTLVHLDLSSNCIAADGMEALFGVLKSNSSLQTLDISGNRIGRPSAKAVGEALVANATLVELCMNGTGIDCVGMQYISLALRRNRTLECLSLTNNKIGDEGMAALGRSLEVNTALSELYLTANSIHDKGIELLCEALEVNSTLRYLEIGSNPFSAPGLRYLALVLEANTSLVWLKLTRIPLVFDGLNQLCIVLKNKNSTLRVLNLKSCGLNDYSAMALGIMLKHNRGITHLILESNQLGDQGLSSLKEGLLHNSGLKYLYVKDNPYISSRALDDLRKSLDEHGRDVEVYDTIPYCSLSVD